MKILFICTHNACRSILSEAIARRLASGRIEVASAGTSPATDIHPLTLEHLTLRSYETRGLHSKNLDAVTTFKPNVAITVCDGAAGESCPIWLGNAIRAHWGLPDPSRYQGSAEESADAFASVIATIESRTTRMLAQPFEAMPTERLTEFLADIGKQH